MQGFGKVYRYCRQGAQRGKSSNSSARLQAYLRIPTSSKAPAMRLCAPHASPRVGLSCSSYGSRKACDETGVQVLGALPLLTCTETVLCWGMRLDGQLRPGLCGKRTCT